VRNFPIYLLIDTSKSMRGEKIEAVMNGMQVLHSALRKDPYMLESAYISVLTFGSDVKQVIPLTEVALFQPPSLSTGGATSLGAALKMATECAKKEVRERTAEEKGDWKPFVFLMTDGYPTDDFQSGLEVFKKYRWGEVFACAAGCNADINVLQNITEDVLVLDEIDASTFSRCFNRFICRLYTGLDLDYFERDEQPELVVSNITELPPPPPEIVLVKP